MTCITVIGLYTRSGWDVTKSVLRIVTHGRSKQRQRDFKCDYLSLTSSIPTELINYSKADLAVNFLYEGVISTVLCVLSEPIFA